MKRGEIWWANLDKKRPVLLLSRDEAYEHRALITIAPLTTKIRGFSVEVRVGKQERLPKPCVINLDTLATVPKMSLSERISTLSGHKISKVNDALRFALALD